MINMVIIARLRTEIDPEEKWEAYVESVQLSPLYSKKWPGLVYNYSSWLADLEAHIIVRRIEKANGTEAKERAKAKVTADICIERSKLTVCPTEKQA